MVEIEEWHPPSETPMPVGPESFPRTGVNSLATLGSRGLARALDALIVGLPYSLVVGIVLLIANGGESMTADSMEGSTAQAQVALIGPLLAIVVLYETVTVALWGQTLGKLALGIRVARQVNGRCPLWWEAGVRIGLPAVVALIPVPFALAVAMGLFTTAGFDPMRRNLTDRAAGTVVVRAR
jgi:uncharacterized RDD family membrane protein YckC